MRKKIFFHFSLAYESFLISFADSQVTLKTMLGPIRQNALQRILLLLIVSHSSAFKYKCPCKNEADCHYPQKDLGTTAEVIKEID